MIEENSMTDKTNEVRNIRKARKLFQRAVDMMDGYRVGDDTGTTEGTLNGEFVEDAEYFFFSAALCERGWCPECDMAETKCECYGD